MPEDGALRIELKGELAGILALAADSKQPAAEGRGGLQATLVAGTRNHLYRTTICWRRERMPACGADGSI